MFEDRTFENILSEMLEYVSETNPELDTRTGSVIYTALAPIALELETAYHKMDMISNETFLETASKEYLIKLGDEFGLEIQEATCGLFEGHFNIDVPIGSRFSLDKFNYTVVQKISDPILGGTGENDSVYRFELVCETAGSEPNSDTYRGKLTPITYIAGLTFAELASVRQHGEDEEDTESYRYRLQLHVKNPPIHGNVAQYGEWLDELDAEKVCAIGKYKVSPCWNGVNTVKLTVLDSNDQPFDTTTEFGTESIAKIQEYFDPLNSGETLNDNVASDTYPQGRGMGNGQSPIGAIVTVDTAKPAYVSITAQIGYKDGYETIGEENVVKAIEDYLKSVAFTTFTVEYMPIWAAIYNAEGVAGVGGLIVSVNHLVGGVAVDTDMNPSANVFTQYVTLNDGSDKSQMEVAMLDRQESWFGKV